MKYIYIYICLLICSYSSSQNIIANGSFEFLTPPLNCNLSNFDQVNDWDQFKYNSPDYFSLLCISGSASLPNSLMGKALPVQGNGISGIYLYSPFGTAREYIYQALQQPLKKNYIYCMQYYVLRASSSEWGASDIDAYFSDSLPEFDTVNYELIASPQIKNYTGIISDTINWVLVTDTFIAKGNETFVTIGNFTTYSNINKTYLGSLSPNGISNAAYIFIDNVSLSVCDSLVKLEPPNNVVQEIPNVFTPNADNVNDTFKIELGEATNIDFKLFNRWGNLIYETSHKTILWDGRTTSGEPCSEGVYFYSLKYTDANGEQQSKNGYVSLFR